jgi:hypothetical protein
VARLPLAVMACLAAVLVLACQRTPAGRAVAPWPSEFAPYPGARRLCAQSSTAGALRIQWTAYATVDEAATVAGFYARTHGVDPGLRPFVVRGRGRTTLAVHEAAATDVPRCPQGPAPNERTVILVSTAAARLASTREPR